MKNISDYIKESSINESSKEFRAFKKNKYTVDFFYDRRHGFTTDWIEQPTNVRGAKKVAEWMFNILQSNYLLSSYGQAKGSGQVSPVKYKFRLEEGNYEVEVIYDEFDCSELLDIPSDFPDLDVDFIDMNFDMYQMYTVDSLIRVDAAEKYIDDKYAKELDSILQKLIEDQNEQWIEEAQSEFDDEIEKISAE